MASRFQNFLLARKRQLQTESDEEEDDTQVDMCFLKGTNEHTDLICSFKCGLARKVEQLSQQVDSLVRRLKPLLEKDEWKQQTQNLLNIFFWKCPYLSNEVMPQDWNRDNPRMKIPNQPTSDATVEDHNLFQEKWLQLEGCWEVNRESFDDILEKAMKIITTVSSGRVQYDAQTDQLLQLHSIAWIHHILSMRR